MLWLQACAAFPQMTSARSQSTMLSLTIHTAAIALALLASKQIAPPGFLNPSASLTPLIAPYLPRPAALAGGGGGARQRAPATAGRLPKIAPRQFVAPTLEILNPHPKLAMEMSIEAPPETALPDRSLATLGDPLSAFMNGSAGKGGPLGIGNGSGTGVGDRRGAGAGPGDGGVGTVYRPGHGVTVPVLVHSVEPEFSEEARRAKYSGTVTLQADIDTSGRPRNIRVVHSLGMGLDEKAIDAVTRWYFRAGTKDGKPVIVSAFIEVMFHLL
jgi:TonB family protein